jgi:general L-amino acid transport system ATP-binding protein
MVTLAQEGMKWVGLKVTDRLIFMDAGEILEENDPESFLTA